MAGGPVYYIKEAFKGKFGKFLSTFFAVAIVLALGFMGCMVQSNAISDTMKTAFGIPSWVMGLVVCVISAFVFLGGVNRLASVTEKLVPIMAVLYILGGIVVLAINYKAIPGTFALIFKAAFVPKAVFGGAIGITLKQAISRGAQRGLFSNEAGMGSTPHAHALANVEKPHHQGTIAMAGVFVDTFVVLTITALMVISTLYPKGGILESGAAKGVTENNMAQFAFSSVFGEGGGSIYVAICLLFFAFSTILGWNLFGKINAEYLFGKKAVPLYTVIALIFVFLGSVLSSGLVWALTDLFNYLMVLPNVIALIALSGIVKKTSKNK